MDAQISKIVWNGKIAVEITLKDVKCEPELAQVFLTSFRRLSYLPLETTKVLEYYKLFTSISTPVTKIWYSIDTPKLKLQPLKWHYPIGLLYDLYATQDDILKLIIHLQDFPHDKLLRMDSIDALEEYFMSVLKEADYLRHGNVKKVFGMPKQDQLDLYKSIVDDDYEKYVKMNAIFIKDQMKGIPIRIYLPDTTVLQRKMNAYTESGQERTLQEALESLDDLQNVNFKLIISNGIQLKAEIKLLELQVLKYQDNLIHIVLQ